MKGDMIIKNIFTNRKELLVTLEDLFKDCYVPELARAKNEVYDAIKELKKVEEEHDDFEKLIEMIKSMEDIPEKVIKKKVTNTINKIPKNMEKKIVIKEEKKIVKPKIKKVSEVGKRRILLEEAIRETPRISAKELRIKMKYGKGETDGRFKSDIKYLRNNYTSQFVTVKIRQNDNNPKYYFQGRVKYLYVGHSKIKE